MLEFNQENSFDVELRYEVKLIDNNNYLNVFCFNNESLKWVLLSTVLLTQNYIKKNNKDYYSYDLFSNKSRV